MKPVLLILTILIAFSCSVKNPSNFDLENIQQKNPEISAIENEVLKVTPTSNNQSLTVWEGTDPKMWKNANYLVCEIWHENDYSGILNVEFYRNEKGTDSIVTQSGSVAGDKKQTPRMAAKIGVLPKLKTKVIFPLEHLNAQEIFMPRFPRQLKGTVLGNRMKPEETSKVVIRFGPWQEPRFTPDFEIAAVYLTKEVPQPFPPVEEKVVDKLGQWTVKEWPGKTRDETELKTLLESQLAAAQTSSFPENWSKYGGWKAKKFEATGFFRTHHDGTRWWMVDPDGYAFVSVGVDCIRDNVSGVKSGQEDLFEWLPDSTDAIYKEGYSDRGKYVQADFYRFNFMRVFGEGWREKWETITSGQIREFGINTIANWSDIDYARKAQIPYVLPLSRFPSTDVKLFRDFPDVFAAEYAENAKTFAQQLDEFKDDRYLIGYFLRNEPTWAFGANDVAFEMFATTQPSESKKEFAHWLAEKYGSIDEFNKNWNLKLTSFEELTNLIFDEYPSEKAKFDFWKFSEILVAKYVNVPCDEVEKVDPNHLNLGMRYAWMSSDLLYKAGERFDSTTQIYSNFRYGFSMDFPDNWQLDKGVSEHTIIRGGLKDSAYSFSINVVQLSGDFPKDFSVWELYEMDKDKYALDMNNALQAQLNSKTFNFSQEKVYVSERKSIETKFNYITREVNLEIEMVGVMYSVFVPPFAFTIGMHIPLEYYQNNPACFKYLINNFGFIQKNS